MAENSHNELSEIKTCFLNSALGWIKISGNANTIATISFVDEPTTGDESEILNECMSQLSAFFAGKLDQFNLPLSPSGTDFQKKVWQELQSIEFGTTISYLDLALRLGDKNLCRAVGAANGKNPIAIVIPCHRVIGNDGALTGYAGGLDKKESLLRFEGALAQLSLF